MKNLLWNGKFPNMLKGSSWIHIKTKILYTKYKYNLLAYKSTLRLQFIV